MPNNSVILYLTSRIISAAGTFFAVALFTRLAGSAEYGQYLLIFAWSTIIFGFATQWMISAYFGVYQVNRMDEYVSTLVRFLGLAVVVVAVGFLGMSLTGFWDLNFLLAVFVLFVCFTIYYNAFEIARARLEAGAAALSMILRSVLIVGLGSMVLWLQSTATALVYAVALAHLLAAIPCWLASGRIQLSYATRDASIHLLRFGWPFMLAVGIWAAGQSVDRLLLAHFMGVAALGAYGAVADMMRQCFSVVGEAITFSMIPVAKRQYAEGDIEATNRTLITAFKACVAAGTFGAAFFIVFGDFAVRVLLGPEIHAQVQDLIILFAVAFGIMALGQHYFLQAIFFTHASFLMPMLSGALLVASGSLSLILIPLYGPKGAVVGLLTGYLLGYTWFAVASRKYWRMPLEFASFFEISALAALFVAGTWLVARVVPNTIALQAVELLVFCALSLFVVYRHGLLHLTSSDAAAKNPKLAS